MLIKICELCGDEFETKFKQSKFCKKTHYKKCENCGKEYRVKNNSRPSVSCSTSCASALSHTEESRQARKENNLKKYGVEYSFQREDVKKKIAKNPEHLKTRIGGEVFQKNLKEKYGVDNWGQTEEHKKRMSENPLMHDPKVKEKVRQTNVERYGKPRYSQTSEGKQKIRETMLKRYGVGHSMQNPEILAKAQATNLQRYGYKSTLSSPEVRKKTHATNLKKYGVKEVLQSPTIRERIAQTNVEKYGHENPFGSPIIQERIRETLLDTYGVINPGQHPDIRARARATIEERINSGEITMPTRVSKINRAFASMLEQETGLPIIFEKVVGKFAHDIHLEGTNILVDIHPTVSHNLNVPFVCLVNACDQPCDRHSTITPDYHFQRARNALSNDFRLIQIYDWENPIDMVDLIARKVNPHVEKISARKLTLSSIDTQDASEFFNNFHIQGSVRGAKYCHQLSLDGSPVAVASFSPERYGRNVEWEFLRYAVRPGFIVQGGAERLFKSFVKEVNPSSVASYVDFNHTTNQRTFLSNVGFREVRPTGAGMMWHNPLSDKTVSPVSLVRHGADRLLGTNYGSREESGLDNEAIMMLEGFMQVPTAGNRVFEWRKEEN